MADDRDIAVGELGVAAVAGEVVVVGEVLVVGVDAKGIKRRYVTLCRFIFSL